MNDLRPQRLITLDLEGVLTPEIWIAVADSTGLDEFRRTTRDEPDYELLMKGRLAALSDNDIAFSDLTTIVDQLEPLPGAMSFLDQLRSEVSVVILSDTFEQLAAPLLNKLGTPLTLCHRMEIVGDRVAGAEVRIPHAKHCAVEALRSLNYSVLAAGDSFNDIEMLLAADRGALFRPSQLVVERHPELPVFNGFDELASWCLSEV